jgi:chromosome segregation ATPase
METLYAIITGLSIISTILAWIAKIRWSKEYALAKDEIIKSKEAEITSVKEQLKIKDELIKVKESQIEHLNSLNPPKLKEYYDSIKSGLEAYNDTLKEELEKSKINFSNTIEKLNKLEPENQTNKLLIETLSSEKDELRQKIDMLSKQIEMQNQTLEATKKIYSNTYSLSGVGLKRQQNLDNEQIIEMLRKIKDNTKFFWKGLIGLDTVQNSVKEEIKQSTYNRIHDGLTALQFAGHLDFKITEAYETITSKEKVYELEAWNISTQLKNFSRQIENGRV